MNLKKLSDNKSHRISDDNVKSVTMRFGDFLNWYFNTDVKNIDKQFLLDNDWDYLASGTGLSLDEVADIFNENYDTQVEFTQYDMGNAKVIDWDLNNIGFEADSMDWLPDTKEVSDSRRVSDSVDFITLCEKLEQVFGGCDVNGNKVQVYVYNKIVNVELSVDQVAYIYTNSARTANDVVDVDRSEFVDDDWFIKAVIDNVRSIGVYGR